MISKEEAHLQFNAGWSTFLNTIYATVEELQFCTGVQQLERRFGMLSVRFAGNDLTVVQQFILDSIAYKIERLSSRVCEVCGEYGFRRVDLATTQSLCTRHYALQYSEEHPTPSPMVPQSPHTDY
jgi:hypothetical protein